ncbi:hypothetical protein ALC56_03835, partial [Trachymyrmex septentrionalis]
FPVAKVMYVRHKIYLTHELRALVGTAAAAAAAADTICTRIRCREIGSFILPGGAWNRDLGSPGSECADGIARMRKPEGLKRTPRSLMSRDRAFTPQESSS